PLPQIWPLVTKASLVWALGASMDGAELWSRSLGKPLVPGSPCLCPALPSSPSWGSFSVWENCACGLGLKIDPFQQIWFSYGKISCSKSSDSCSCLKHQDFA
uniref:Uncharacterized protein n=1 Tax=Junco hyemalis TaxID=40217 RepID=A0A8C5J1Z0_JUNHY